tara:strand:+ start:4658 stop:7411 length:2754 start_codon:yes stop_codon:yes gene_type:complete
MGTQNLNNYYFKKVGAKLDYSSYYDLFLASDEKDFNQEVIYSTSIIGYNDGAVLPAHIDLNLCYQNPGACCSQPNTLCSLQYPVLTGAPQASEPFTILSRTQWVSAQTICDCSGVTEVTLCDVKIGKTARSNGLYHDLNIQNLESTPPSDCIRIRKKLPLSGLFDKLQFDKRLKLSQVKAYGLHEGNSTGYFTDTSIGDAQDKSGYYQELKGGFYQGFYKLHGYPYQVLPTRPEKGWTFSTYLKVNTLGETMNPNNQFTGRYGNCYTSSGFNIFGTTPPFQRSATTFCSENNSVPSSPFWPKHQLNYSWLGGSTIYSGRTNNEGFFFYKGLREGGGIGPTGHTYEDTYSNALGIRLTDDMRLCYRALRYTASCVNDSADISETEAGQGGYTCNTLSNWECGYKVEEECTEPICQFFTLSGNCRCQWIQVDVVFERNHLLKDCDLFNKGGINDLIKNNTIYPYIADDACDTFTPGLLDFNCNGATVDSWFDEKSWRMGTLKFYVNGRIIHTVNDYEEIIPRHTNKAVNSPASQFGVPYTMSWGGGAWGYRESGATVFDDIIADNFGGSFVGGISQMMYYIKPLQADEIYHNFTINKDRYELVDCEECENCRKSAEDPQYIGCHDCDLAMCSTFCCPMINIFGCSCSGTTGHVWSLCGGSGYPATLFEGITEVYLINSNLPSFKADADCLRNNTVEFWLHQGGSGLTIGDSIRVTNPPNPGLACFTYMGTASTSNNQTIDLAAPWVITGAYSGNTAFKNCCECTLSTSTACMMPMYKCVSGTCVDLGDGTGTYTSVTECQLTCISSGSSSSSTTSTYNCGENGMCTSPGDGSGNFSGPSAYADCLSLCSCSFFGCGNLLPWLPNARGQYSISVINYVQYDTVMHEGTCYHCLKPYDGGSSSYPCSDGVSPDNLIEWGAC